GHGYIMIALHHPVAPRPHPFEAFYRVGPIAHDVAEAINRIHLFRVDRCKGGTQGLKVGMDIRDDGELHVSVGFGRQSALVYTTDRSNGSEIKEKASFP